MKSDEHKKQVLQALERNLEKDRAKTKITEVSVLGLVEMTRKRTRESLEHILCEPCNACGAGSFKNRGIHVSGNIPGDYSGSKAV